MTVPLHPQRNEGGCPIITAVRRPVAYPGSPPHATPTQDLEVIALVSPDVIHDLGQPPSQGHAGDLLALPLLNGPEPGPQGSRPAARLRGGPDQGPADEAVALLADVPQPDPVGTGSARGVRPR